MGALSVQDFMMGLSDELTDSLVDYKNIWQLHRGTATVIGAR